MRRSMLFVPGNNPKMMTSCGFFGADAIIFDLEDAVSPDEKDAARLLVFAALASAASVAALWLLRKLFKALEGCDSVFCEELVKRMKAFGWSLLPLAVLASVAETVARRFMAAGVTAVYIQWGLLIAFAVTMCLAVVFRYGVKLQRESDETL